MKEFITDLFEGQENWRLQVFIDKMEDFKKQCTTNQEEEFIRQGLFRARDILKEREFVTT